mgnify:FL=1
MKERVFQVNELIQKELGQILLRELEFPEDIFMTITRVEASPNLQEAKVYISVIPEGGGREVLKILKQNVFRLQQILNKRLRMRPVPKIRWMLHKELSKAQRVEGLLDTIQQKGYNS